MQILQREPDRTVVLQDDGRTVRKIFHGSDPDALRPLARREYERMTQFSDALADLDTAKCPRALGLDLSAEPSVLMERAAGIPLQDHLAATTWDADLFERLGGVLQGALVRYVATFKEPYWDFIFRNMFYEPEGGVVTFLDFGIPRIYLPALDDFQKNSPIEVSLGSLVASSIFEAARPRRLARRREHRQAPELASVVLRRSLHEPENANGSVEGVRQVARIAYALASGGGPLRRAWYGSAGRLLARPATTLDRVCAAVSAHS